MNLTIDGAARELFPIKGFRAEHDLPIDFEVARFEPKDYTGLGSIEQASAELAGVRRAVLAALPPDGTSLQDWQRALPHLEMLFREQLEAINSQVGLAEAEIEFAVAGFADVCRAVLFEHLRAQALKQSAPAFAAIYANWLNESVRISSTVHPYVHQGDEWYVQIITYAYGRCGLRVKTSETTYYVGDVGLACPAAGYMAGLLGEIAARMTVGYPSQDR